MILVPLFLILLTIFIWCFYFSFIRAFLSRRKLVYVEVQSYSEDNNGNRASYLVSRKQAKSNLKLVVETTTGLKIENSRFDRYWFDERRTKLNRVQQELLDNQEDESNIGLVAGYSHDIFTNLISNQYQRQNSNKKLGPKPNLNNSTYMSDFRMNYMTKTKRSDSVTGGPINRRSTIGNQEGNTVKN